MKTYTRSLVLLFVSTMAFSAPHGLGGETVLVEDNFSGLVNTPPDDSKFDWAGEVIQDGSGQLYMNTLYVNQSWISSKASAAPTAGQTLVSQMRVYAYAENPAVYGDQQPRGLRVGSDANNAIEFYSISAVSLGMRVRKDGVESLASYDLPSRVDTMHNYKILVTTTSVTFKVDEVVTGTITTNIPTGALNSYVSTHDGWAGQVPVKIDSLSLTLSEEDAQGFADDFEAAELDPFWRSSVQNGTIIHSTIQAHGGTQSAQFATAGGGQKELHLRHFFDEAQWGEVTVWVYDSLQYIYFNVNLENSALGTIPLSINAQDWDTSAYYYDPSMTGSANEKSSVPREVGWRKFTLRSLEDELVLSVDDQELYRGAGVEAFDTIRLSVTGPANGTIYFDDFSCTATENAPQNQPAINNVTPDSGLVGSNVTITGSNFAYVTSVQFNGVEAEFSVISPLQINATVPSSATSGAITVSNSIGDAVSASTFTVTTPAPTINSFTPGGGPVGLNVTIYGSDFNGTSSVQFNGVEAEFTLVSDTQIDTTVPDSATSGTITVSNSMGDAVSASAFTVTAPAPTINSFTPGGGPVGLNVTIYGSDFNGTSSVQFNGVEAEFTLVSDTQIDTTVPDSATSGAITVSNSMGDAVSISTFTVTDSATIVSVCDEASLDAALSNNSGEIIFDCDGTIEITSTKDILSHLTLDANGHDVTISGGDAVRLFTVNTAVHFTLRNLTITNGRYETLGGGIYNYGGVIDAIDCTFRNNVAFGMNGGSAKGGAIYNLSGSLNLTRCTFADNKASGGMGNVGADNGGTGGTGGYGYGGGIYNDGGTGTITNCTFHGNKAIGGRGGTGGRGRDGYVYWYNLPWPQSGYWVTVPGGPGGRGGNGGNGLGGSFYNLSGTSTMINTTLARGSALGGSGGSPGLPGNYASGDYGPGSPGVDSNGGNICATSGVVTLKNTIIAYGEGNSGYNCSGTMTDNGNNICSDASAALTSPNSMSETDPLLASALASNGGPTMTLALLKQSPAINAGDDALAPQTDQRHFARDGQSDIGAYEIPIYTYTSDNGEITLTGYNGPSGDVDTPSLINGMPVVQIGDSTFRDIDCITGVTIPDTVTSIGYMAFYHCSGLIGNLSIPSSVTSMGDMSFGFCGGLTGVYFRGDAPTPNASVFSYADNITVYYLPDATGWGVTYGGRPTVLWNPKIQQDANLGVQANVFGFNISAPNDFSVVVESSPDLSEGSWVPVETKTLLEGSCYFSDPQWTDYPCRFYRLRMP